MWHLWMYYPRFNTHSLAHMMRLSPDYLWWWLHRKDTSSRDQCILRCLRYIWTNYMLPHFTHPYSTCNDFNFLVHQSYSFRFHLWFFFFVSRFACSIQCVIILFLLSILNIFTIHVHYSAINNDENVVYWTTEETKWKTK